MKPLALKLLCATALLVGCLGSSRAAGAGALEAARDDLQAGRADEALRKLAEAVRQSPRDAEAFNLTCRTYLAEELWDEAIAAGEQAVQLAPTNSACHMWLGRAYGEKASRVSFISAYALARKVLREFETAVRADPRNAEAFSELGEFYAEAPAIIGGGADKAEALARRLEVIDRARAHALRARVAEGQKDYGKAESEWKAAVTSAAAKPAEYWMTLGAFYGRRERWADMMNAIRSGFAADTEHGPALPHGAEVLIRARQAPQLAAELLESYLASPNKTEEAPAFVCHVQLARLKAQSGDTAGAQREFTAAAALAHNYKPATEGTPTDR
jgi:tetratricopeptide (TPR) repeat protein